MKSIITTLLLAALILASCGKHGIAPDADNGYADTALWYNNGKALNTSLPDVFYILPTCIHDWTDSLGQVQHNANPYDTAQRQKMLPSYQLADEIFGDSANFLAPYYRQATLETWTLPEDTIMARFNLAFSDLSKSFAYYINNINNGRPFVLAGFSQGGKGVVELIKNMDPEVHKRMIAAYVCGYRVTEQDLKASTLLRPAKGADDTGVCIVYNSVTDTSANCPAVSEGNQFVINPVSWTTDTLWHARNDSVAMRIDPVHNSILTRGIDAEECYIESLGSLFIRGNLHLYELLMYQDLLRDNVKLRARAFSGKR